MLDRASVKTVGGITMHDPNRMTTPEYWEQVHARQPRMRLPSKLSVPTRNLQRLLKRYIMEDMRVLEIGFAPGKQLSYIAKVVGANVSGLDYSETGIAFARMLFETLEIEADMRCEDLFSTTFESDQFDVVYSVGLVEHFDDPSPVVRRHVELVRPGGVALITIPNFGGLYGRLRQKFDPKNLAIHNLDIMNCEAMRDLAPGDLVSDVETYLYGRATPALTGFHTKWHGRAASLFALLVNNLGLLQPIDIPAVSPMIVLKMIRA